jgi:adenosylcobinamide-GDP ribazoletransferase
MGRLRSLGVGRDYDDLSWLGAAPLLGVAIGFLSALLLGALRGLSDDPYQQLLGSAIAIGSVVVLTGARGVDGLARIADGTGEIGATGVAAVTLVVLMESAALWQAVAIERGTVSLITAVATGHCALLWGNRRGVSSTRTPVTANDGLDPQVVLLGTLWVLTLTAAAGAVDDHRGARGAAHVGVAVLLGLAAAIGLRKAMTRGGAPVRPALLGAMVQVATATTLVVMAYDVPGG